MRTRLPVALAVVFAAPALVAGACSSDKGSAASVTTWERAASSAFTPLADRIPVMARQRSQFTAGTLSAQQYSTELGQSESVLASTLKAALRLPPYPGNPLVDRLYAATASLYVEAVRCEIAGVGLPAGDLRDQVTLIATRLRELADRTFDQGRVLTVQGLTPAGVPAGTRVVLPAEVPDWAAEGIAAGPPLAPAPPPANRYAPVRQGARPTEPPGRWSAAVNALQLPAPGQLRSLDETAAAATASRLQRDTDAVGSMPDPAVRSGREESVRLRLEILVEAEACRLAQVADLADLADLAAPSSAPQFRSVSGALLAVAGSFPR